MRALLLAPLLCLLGACSLAGFNRPVEVPPPALVRTPSGLGVETLRAGEGRPAAAGDRVRVHYVGRLVGGGPFDSSRDRGVPLEFELGAGEVMPGWDEGMLGMRPGELRRLHVPARLGYGEAGLGEVIPPRTDLLLEVELLDFVQ